MSIIHRICITFANCIARCFNPPPWLSEGLELPEDIYLLDTCLKDPSVHFFIHGQLQLKEHLVNFTAQEQVNLYKKGEPIARPLITLQNTMKLLNVRAAENNNYNIFLP